MSYVACDKTCGYKILTRKLLGKEHPCELLMGVLDELLGRCRLYIWQTVVNAVMDSHGR